MDAVRSEDSGPNTGYVFVLLEQNTIERPSNRLYAVFIFEIKFRIKIDREKLTISVRL